MLFPRGRCQFLGIVEEKTSDLELAQRWLKLLGMGKEHMESQESCPLEQIELFLCSSELTVPGDAGCV